MMNYFTLGLVAHVDAGKTTLSEGLLLSAGAIASAGRVDHGDASRSLHNVLVCA